MSVKIRIRGRVVKSFDFFIFCLNKTYGKLFSKYTLKGLAVLNFFKMEGSFK